jgi:hypothetical protein
MQSSGAFESGSVCFRRSGSYPDPSFSFMQGLFAFFFKEFVESLSLCQIQMGPLFVYGPTELIRMTRPTLATLCNSKLS